VGGTGNGINYVQKERQVFQHPGMGQACFNFTLCTIL